MADLRSDFVGIKKPEPVLAASCAANGIGIQRPRAL